MADLEEHSKNVAMLHVMALAWCELCFEVFDPSPSEMDGLREQVALAKATAREVAEERSNPDEHIYPPNVALYRLLEASFQVREDWLERVAEAKGTIEELEALWSQAGPWSR